MTHSPILQARALIIEARVIVRALQAREASTNPPRLTPAEHFVPAVLAEAIDALDDAEHKLAEVRDDAHDNPGHHTTAGVRAGPIGDLTPEEREGLIAGIQALDVRLDRLFENWGENYPRIVERRLRGRFEAALFATLDDGGPRDEFTEDEFDDAEVILLAVAEYVRGARLIKHLLGTGGPELKVLKGGRQG